MDYGANTRLSTLWVVLAWGAMLIGLLTPVWMLFAALMFWVAHKGGVRQAIRREGKARRYVAASGPAFESGPMRQDDEEFLFFWEQRPEVRALRDAEEHLQRIDEEHDDEQRQQDSRERMESTSSDLDRIAV